MAIYENPVRILIKDMISALAPRQEISFSKDQALWWFEQNYPKIKKGTISAHLVRFSTNAESRLHHSIREDEDILFQIDRSHFRLYNPGHDPAPIHSTQDAIESAVEAQELIENATDGKFAYESDLRDFLAKNLQVIEPGLRLYQEEGITGIEFQAGGGFIDILAVDASGKLVVIELKVSRGYDRVVGQILRYMGWIRKNQAEPGQEVRGIIAAREISKDLVLACSSLPDVSLYEYELSVKVRKVGVEGSIEDCGF